jgi:hypothetical protein
MYKPVLSTLIRSVDPAPIKTVLVNPDAPCNWPITVLLLPVVIEQPAHVPIAMLLVPYELFFNE